MKKAIESKFEKEINKYSIHEEIANILEKSPSCLRKLEEETYHLHMSKSFFKLKETISDIENFLLLFNPQNKYKYCY